MNYIVWFDIPVVEIDRACAFYSAVLNIKIEKQEFDSGKIGVFPHAEKKGVAGCLAESKEQPSMHGPLLYLNVNGRLDDAIAKTKEKGGEILKEKHSIGEYGFRAVIKDSEGNRVALHSDSN